ncbi:hypothetical protein K402DRAFT_22223 [Aulographum hederae CBS 113979]|uniref:Uncharacterized protein n=1 Tax=Aulographum hederae CBS 113979 TaxID=1176131 RepID=A0A6G1H6P8_9PEZI|nr:hypothetical protein K402DRAFT_22223 [Aulographum hederae CBS 113979]
MILPGHLLEGSAIRRLVFLVWAISECPSRPTRSRSHVHLCHSSLRSIQACPPRPLRLRSHVQLCHSSLRSVQEFVKPSALTPPLPISGVASTLLESCLIYGPIEKSSSRNFPCPH